MLALLALAALQSIPAGDGVRPPLASGLVRAVEVARAAPAFVQHFRLDAGELRAERAPLGLARYVAGPDPEGGTHVELELELFAPGLRLIHVEQANLQRRRLVFRELGARAARTLFLEGRPSEPLLGYELGGPEVLRRTTEAGGILPLLLLESQRRGALPPGELRVLDPLSTAFEPLALAARDDALGRVLEARRADGSLRWRAVLAGAELAELRFQERGPLARPIAPEEFARWRERHEQETRSAREAAAARARPWDGLLEELQRQRPR
jgi:hypothetical protein